MRFIFCLVFLAITTTAAEGAKLRTWTSANGKFKIRAKFVELETNARGDVVVVLEKADGKVIRVPLDKLGTKDQEYVETQRRKAVAPATKKPIVDAKGDANKQPSNVRISG